MKQPALSIIIPVHNAEQYLPGCLDSILAAGLEGAEVLLIDDGSTDRSGALCRKYAENHPYIRQFSQGNLGPSAARNRGLELSCGQYVAFFDADDYVIPAALRKTAALLEKCPGGEIWVSDFCRVSDCGCVLDKVYQIDDTPEPIQDKEYLQAFLGRGDCVWNVWRYLFQREFLMRGGLCFVEGADCAEDLEFVVRALTKVEKPVFFHNPYYFYRVNYGATLTRKYDAKRVEHLTAMLQCSAEYLRKQSSEGAQLLLNKIALEFFLNLALLQEVVPGDRARVRALLQETAWIMGLADKRMLKLLGDAVKGLGVDGVSKTVYCMKRVKRRLRSMKIAVFAASK